MSLIAIAKATQIMAAISSIALARRRVQHVPAAVALVVLTAISLARGSLRLALAPLPRPIEGAARVLVYADGAAELATYAGRCTGRGAWHHAARSDRALLARGAPRERLGRQS